MTQVKEQPRSPVRSPAGELTMARLALADLRHEWVLTLCLVAALAAIIAPLLILLGLRNGTVETLRCALVEDPGYRELRPEQTRTFVGDWFERWRAREDVAFLVPTILPAASVIGAVHPVTGAMLYLDLIPTALGDPLILENGGVIPREGEVVLSREAAKEMGVGQGSVVDLRITRTRSGRAEEATVRARVAAVLGARADTLARVYAPLDFVLDVESYKEGMAVPRRGWDGGNPTPYASFDGVVVLSPETLSPVLLAGLRVNTGLTRDQRLDDGQLSAAIGVNLPRGWSAHLLSSDGSPIGMDSLGPLRAKLRGTGALTFPVVEGLRLRLHDPEPDGSSAQEEIPVRGLSLSENDAQRLSVPPVPWGALSEDLADFERLGQILLPQTGPARPAGALDLVLVNGVAPLTLKVRIGGDSGVPVAVVPAELLGMLRTGREREIRFDAAAGGLILARAGFQGFRLYARSIDDVEPVVEALRTEGIEVLAQTQAIARVRTLDDGLARVFSLVAVVGIGGGAAALVMSLFAAVQRKRRQLGVMRLLGLERHRVARFPVYQGVVVALLGLALATLLYGAVSSLANALFASELLTAAEACGQGLSLSTLPRWTLPVAVLASLVLALFSALAAALETTRIDPSEALREE